MSNKFDGTLDRRENGIRLWTVRRGLVNLVGRTDDCIKTPDHKDEILRSRVEATDALGVAVRSVRSPPPVWVQMATAHIYGDPPTVVCSEDSPFGLGLAPLVGKAWEDAFQRSALPSQRQVILRTSFVIGRDRERAVALFLGCKRWSVSASAEQWPAGSRNELDP